MNPYVRLGAILGRIASATSVVRTRSEDAARLENNGGDTVAMNARVEAVNDRLERVAIELEGLL